MSEKKPLISEKRRAQLMGRRERVANKMINQVLGALERSGVSDVQAAKLTAMSPGTFGRWRAGKTRWPRADTIESALHAAGGELIIKLRNGKDSE